MAVAVSLLPAITLADRGELTGAEAAVQFYEETPHLLLTFVQWTAGDEALELVDRSHFAITEEQYDQIDRDLDPIRRLGLAGTARVRTRGRFDVGRESRLVVVMHSPVTEWVSIGVPDTSDPVVFLQDGDEFRVLPAGVPHTDRTIEIGPCGGDSKSHACYFVQLADSVVLEDMELPGGAVIPQGTRVPRGKSGGGIGLREPFVGAETPR